jgi:hypothetical protein
MLLRQFDCLPKKVLRLVEADVVNEDVIGTQNLKALL